jgi:hypothetical protein
MADLRTVAESEAGSMYKTDTAQIAEGAAIRRGAGLTITDGVAAEITMIPGSTSRTQEFAPPVVQTEGAQTYTVGPFSQIEIRDKIATVSEIQARTGLVPNIPDGSFSAADVVDGVLNITIRYPGMVWLPNSVYQMYDIDMTNNNFSDLPSPDFDAFDPRELNYGTDYDIEETKSVTEDGTTVVNVALNVVSGGWLEKILALPGRSVNYGWTVKNKTPHTLTPETDYTVDVVTSGGSVKTIISLVGDQGYSESMWVTYIESTVSGSLDALAIADTRPTDARIIAVYTAGQFKKALVPNYSPIFKSDTITFV